MVIGLVNCCCSDNDLLAINIFVYMIYVFKTCYIVFVEHIKQHMHKYINNVTVPVHLQCIGFSC